MVERVQLREYVVEAKVNGRWMYMSTQFALTPTGAKKAHAGEHFAVTNTLRARLANADGR